MMQTTVMEVSAGKDDSEAKNTCGTAAALASPPVFIAAFVIGLVAEYCYITSGIYWDPLIALIPLLVAFIPAAYYLEREIRNIPDETKRDRALWWTGLLASLCIIASGLIKLYPRAGGTSDKWSFILGMSFGILALLLILIYIRVRAERSQAPSEESYQSLLKTALFVILIDLAVFAGCVIIGQMYGGADLLLLAMFAIFCISVVYFVAKMRSLGFAS